MSINRIAVWAAFGLTMIVMGGAIGRWTKKDPVAPCPDNSACALRVKVDNLKALAMYQKDYLNRCHEYLDDIRKRRTGLCKELDQQDVSFSECKPTAVKGGEWNIALKAASFQNGIQFFFCKGQRGSPGWNLRGAAKAKWLSQGADCVVRWADMLEDPTGRKWVNHGRVWREVQWKRYTPTEGQRHAFE